MRSFRTAVVVVAFFAAGAASAAELNCHGPSNVEDFHYSWRMRGGLAWIAGLVFPTSGKGELRTVFPAEGQAQPSISSELLITAADPVALAPLLAARLRGDELIVLKASRGVALERILPFLAGFPTTASEA